MVADGSPLFFFPFRNAHSPPGFAMDNSDSSRNHLKRDTKWPKPNSLWIPVQNTAEAELFTMAVLEKPEILL